MQEVLMLVAAALMSLSIYKPAALDQVAIAHLTAAFAAQGLGGEAAVAAQGLLIDALGPGDGHRVGGFRCLTFDLTAAAPDSGQCRAFSLTVGGSAAAQVEGGLCPTEGRGWSESAQGTVSSRPLEQLWREGVLKTGASLYRETTLSSLQSRFDWPNTKIEVGGFSYHDAQTFALIRLPNGETHYVLKSDLAANPPSH